MSRWLPNSSLSHSIWSMISSSAGSFPAGKSVENGSPPGMHCCAGSRAHRKTIHLPGLSNAVIGMPSPPPSNPARCRSRKGKWRQVTATLVYGLFTISTMRKLAEPSSPQFGSKPGVNARNCSKQPFPACVYTASALAWGSLWHCSSPENSHAGRQSRQ
jgi:hypothetical protein